VSNLACPTPKEHALKVRRYSSLAASVCRMLTRKSANTSNDYIWRGSPALDHEHEHERHGSRTSLKYQGDYKQEQGSRKKEDQGLDEHTRITRPWKRAELLWQTLWRLELAQIPHESNTGGHNTRGLGGSLYHEARFAKPSDTPQG
jgi:hypothetical protein